jgi:K+-transporting ATPase ATPase C chain
MNTPTVAVARESLLRHLRTAVLMTLVLTVLLGVIYPLVLTAVAQVLFTSQANGSLIRDSSGTVIGSSLLGQSFAQPRYFHPRPSAAGNDGYDATNSGGSNLGPTNQKLIDNVHDRATAYRAENGLAADAPVPVDAVTSSASGLDPDISPANAQLQANRVAQARGLSASQVQGLIDQHTTARTLFVFGEPRVNVLELNLALDAMGKS